MVLTDAYYVLNLLTVEGFIDSAPNTTYILEFCDNTECDPSGYGEGGRLLGTFSATTYDQCVASFAFTMGAASIITVTATDPLGNTSEFSACFVVSSGFMGEPEPVLLDSMTLKQLGPAGPSLPRKSPSSSPPLKRHRIVEPGEHPPFILDRFDETRPDRITVLDAVFSGSDMEPADWLCDCFAGFLGPSAATLTADVAGF